jgi:hypothetical protein
MGSTEKPASIASQYRDLNNLSRVAGERLDDDAIRNFTDSVVDASVPASAFSSHLKHRLFALERQHRRTRDVGITETSLVRGINLFASRIGAPEFAKTNVLQLRLFRARLHFMGLQDVVAPGLGQGTAKLANPPINPDVVDFIPAEIAPAEATVLIANLLRTKLLNEEMQVAPDEWSQKITDRKEKARKEQIAAMSSNPGANVTSTSPVAPAAHSLLAFEPTPESKALQSNLAAFSQTLQSPSDLERELEQFIEESRHE